MKRRGFLATTVRTGVATAAGGLLAGCTGDSSRGASGTSAESSDPAGQSRDTRLHLQSATDREYALSPELLVLDTATVATERTWTAGPGETLDLDSEFAPGEDYRFVVRHDGEKLANVSIYDYEGYVLTVRPGPEVEITSQIEI